MKFLIRPLNAAGVMCGVQSGSCGRQCDRCGNDCTMRFFYPMDCMSRCLGRCNEFLHI